MSSDAKVRKNNVSATALSSGDAAHLERERA
jgi:hypothetical protein